MEEQTVIPGVQTAMRERLTHDPRLQFRKTLDLGRIADFASDMQEGTRFDPVVAFYDGTTIWLSDGYHRDAAAEALDWHTIEADIREGTFLDALFYAYRANAAPGHKQLSARERRDGIKRIVLEASECTDTKIASETGVSSMTVGRIRQEVVTLTNVNVDQGPRIDRNGRAMDTSRIGRTPRAPRDAEDGEAPAAATPGAFEWPELEHETPEERAFYALSRQRLICRYGASAIAATAPNPVDDLPGFEEFAAWLDEFITALRARTRVHIAQ